MPPTIAATGLKKSFGKLIAVNDISFQVEAGEIFGLLGPNGAGKTTTIRLILDIFKPDSGQVEVLGGPMDGSKKDRIGYMPEERGLYRDVPLERCLVYLAELKGLSPTKARTRLEPYLEAFDLADHRKKKVGELSKGMQQKAQIIATLVHAPELVIIDEPFAGLDPVNTRLVKEVLSDLRDQGVSMVMSTHQLHQVEALCDRLVLIHRGQVILYGELEEIRRQHSGREVLIESPVTLPSLPGVENIDAANGLQRVSLGLEVSPQQILQNLVAMQVPINHFEIARPSLDEIFIEAVGEPVESEEG